MKSCKNCAERKTCNKICPAIESRLPGVDAGRNPKVEVHISPDALEAIAEKASWAEWCESERTEAPLPDLGALTKKERQAVVLIAKGLSMRAAARKLGIHIKSFQSRIESAKKRLPPRHFPQLVERRGQSRNAGKGA
jgi:DNA-binding CsgD family transcriptional regulator